MLYPTEDFLQTAGEDTAKVTWGSNYSEEASFFWRERRRWRYACPSSLHDAAAPLSNILHRWARHPSCDCSALDRMGSSPLWHAAAVSASQNLVSVTAPSEWPLSRLLASWLLAFSGKQPLHRFSELAAHLQEYFGSNLNVATLYRGEVVLADPDTLGKLLLRHIESAEFSNPSPNRFPVHGDGRSSTLCP
jgi:hypothetical protein